MEKKIFALGFFDGVHLGHQALLKACVELAAQMDVETAAITFENHPQSLFVKQTPPLLTTLQDRYRLLLQYGIDHVYTYPVTEKVMSTDWQVFLDELMLYGGVGFVCGHDFRFGHKGEGDAEKLRRYCEAKGLPCIIVPEQTMDGIRISSTHIRQLVEQGNRFQIFGPSPYPQRPGGGRAAGGPHHRHSHRQCFDSGWCGGAQIGGLCLPLPHRGAGLQRRY